MAAGKSKGGMSTRAGVAPAEPVTGETSERTIRMSVKVSTSDHRALQRDKLQMSEDLGGQRVTDQDVMSALLSIMLDDDKLRSDVVALMRKSA